MLSSTLALCFFGNNNYTVQYLHFKYGGWGATLNDISVIEFQDQFRTEDDCLQFIEKLRWPKGFRCPNCDHDFGYRLNTRRLIQCAVCRRQTSVTAGTIFHKSRTPLRHWFWMIFQIAQDKGGASSVRLAKQLGMFQSTVWNQLHKLRHAMQRRDEGISLAGFIELDEAIIGPHARKTGRQKEKQGGPRLKTLGKRKARGTKRKTQTEVIIMVERENGMAGNIAMKVVYKTTHDDVREAVGQFVEDNHQSFKSDALQSNFAVRSLGHKLLAMKLSGSDLACEELPVVHRAISLLKRYLMGTYHTVSSR